MKLTLFFDRDFPIPDLAQKTYAFDAPDGKSAEWRIGRAYDNDLRINDRRVSRYHCAVAYSAISDRWSISDLSSTYGTQLDGKGLTPGDWEPIKIGSRFSLGFSDLEIFVVEDEYDTVGGGGGSWTLGEPEQEAPSWHPKTWADTAYLAVDWLLEAKTLKGKIWRLVVACVLVAVGIVAYLHAR